MFESVFKTSTDVIVRSVLNRACWKALKVTVDFNAIRSCEIFSPNTLFSTCDVEKYARDVYMMNEALLQSCGEVAQLYRDGSVFV